jgi:hypothetical protein
MRWPDTEYRLYMARRRSVTTPTRGAEDVPESRLLAQVTAEAKRCGWLVYRTADSRRSAPGFPDLVLCNGQRVIFAELKRQQGKLTPEQNTWLSLLRHTDLVEVYVWRPQDWPGLVDTLRRAG